MNSDSIKVPQTDEEVKQVLYDNFANPTGAYSAYDLYCIYRKRDKMTVLESYEKVLQIILNIDRIYTNEQ